MIPDYIDKEALDLIDKLFSNLNNDLIKLLNKVMPHRDGNPHWVMLMGLGIFITNYTSGRINHNFEIEESLGHAFSQMMENEEIQHHIAKIVTLTTHGTLMGGLQ